ncbi:hypothetical protein [Sediminispirochaeta bajacaliforniensis]|uniref:hypothetical protein n=1 Tax=Sediminispirochaeta bajacaliforniensis TaxID=148 RepID=UPI000360F90A|nr:hypothetical protein [Sediminispirochaeta bajacaliforniensis]
MNIFFYQKLNSIWTSNLEKIRSEFSHVRFLAESDNPDIEVVIGARINSKTALHILLC